MTRHAVEAAYGRPTAITAPLPDWRYLIYDELGLAVRLFRGQADWILVFRSGSAKERWAIGGGLLGR